jgi:hypothetical protein
MPTTAQAKKAWDHGRKSQNHYNALTTEQKAAFWYYGRDNGLVDRNNLDEYKAKEYDRFVFKKELQYAPNVYKNKDYGTTELKADPDNYSANLKADKYANYTGPTVPLRKETPLTTVPTPMPKLSPTQLRVNAELQDEPLQIPKQPTKQLVVGKGVKKQIKPQAKITPKGLNQVDNPVIRYGAQGASLLLEGVNNLIQSPATISVRAGEGVTKAETEGKNIGLGLLKGIGTGINDVLTGQNTVNNAQLIEAVAPKTTEELKTKYPKAYNVASTLAEFVGVDDVIGLGIISDIAKVRKLNDLPTSTKALNELFSKIKTNAPLTVAEQAIVKDNPDLISTIRKDLGITDQGFTRTVNSVDDASMQNPLLNSIRKDLNITPNNKVTVQTNLKPLATEPNINTQPIVNSNLKPNVATPITTSKVYTDMQPPKSQIVSSKKNENLGFWDNMNKVYTRIVDTSNPIKKADMPTYIKATNAKSVGGIVDNVLKEGLRDINGNKVNKSLREVVEVIPKGKENEFWDYMLHRNNIDRAREGKAVYTDYTSEMSAEASRRFESAYPEYKKIGDNIVKWIDDFTRTWGVDVGTINKEMYDSLKDAYKNYIPTNRDFSTLEDGIPQGVRSKFVDQRTPIKKATGSDRDIVNPVENIMNLVNRTIRTAKYNEVGKTLLESVRKAPEKMKQFAEEIAVKDGMFANTDNIVTVMENGKPTYMKINNIDLLTSLNAVPKQINNIKYISNAMNLYKGLITQKNPIFAIRNIFRDIPTAYVYGSEKNPVKFGADLLKAGKQAVTNGEMLQKYKSVGGGGANFFNSGNVTKSASELTKKEGMLHPIKAIEKFNNLTETAPRLAEFTRVYENTGDIEKALYAANDVTVNFSRGGDITKSLDKGVPYLNAGVQGLDKFFREVKNNPLQVITKAGISITAPTIGLYLINKDNPNYQELDNRTKDTYFLIPNNSDLDKNGNARTFIKLPKSRELGVLFSSLFERSTRAAKGEDKAFKGFANTVATNFSPTNPMENNILSPLAYNIPTNKDFAQRSIVPQGMIMDNRSPYLQYDEKTSEIAKKIGELTKDINGGVSPKQVDYIMKSYLGIIAQYGLPLNTKGSDPIKSLTTQFKADPIYSNQTLTDFYDNLDKSKRVAADKNIIGKIPSKLVTPEEKVKNILNKASLEISDINKEIRKLDQVADKAKIEALRIKILNIAKNANNMVK